MTRTEKEQRVAELVAELKSVKGLVVTEYLGTSVTQLEELRKVLREQGSTYKVVKNSLVKRALATTGMKIDDESILDKPVAFATTLTDEVALAKAVVDFGKKCETIKPVAGIVNQQFVPASTISRLAQLPSREQLIAQIVISLGSLPTKMVRTINQPLVGLVQALGQIQKQKEA